MAVDVMTLTAQDQEDLEAGRDLRQATEMDLLPLTTVAIRLLVMMAVRLNAEVSEYTHAGVTIKGEPVGDWKVTVEKLEAEKLNTEEGSEEQPG